MTHTVVVVEFEFPAVGKQRAPRIFYWNGLSTDGVGDGGVADDASFILHDYLVAIMIRLVDPLQ